MSLAFVAALLMCALMFFAGSGDEVLALFVTANVWFAVDWLNDQRRKGK